MKFNFFFIGIIVATITMITACIKEDHDTLVLQKRIVVVNIDDPYEVQNTIVIENGSLNKGNLPASTPGNNNLSSSVSSIQVNNGGTLILPFIYDSSHDVRKIYLQVLGADGSYYTVKPTIVTTTTGYSYISIQIPEGMTNGTFTFQYKVEDGSGQISNLSTSVVTVTDIVASCSNAFAEGSSGLTFTPLYLGNVAGEVSISYNTYSVPDRIDIYQGDKWLTGTGTDPGTPIPPLCRCSSILPGFVGKSGTLSFYFNPSQGKNITVVVSGCLDGGTAWEWYLIKSPECK